MNDKIVDVNLSQAEMDEKLQRVLEGVNRTEETIIAMRRGNAAGALKAKLA